MTTGNFGKTVKFYLIDGTPNGAMTCELSNWIGKAYKIPRTFVKDYQNRDELRSPGIYMLFGKDTEDPEKDMAYIGEAEDIIVRLKQHIAGKEFWNDSVAVISKDNNLNKAHIKYLEKRLYEIAIKADRYKIENAVIPTGASLSEPDTAEMNEFCYNIKMLISMLGYKVFEEIQTLYQNEDKTFYIKATRGADARGQLTSEGFLVLKNSKIAVETVNSFPKTYEKLRNDLISNGIVGNKNGELVFLKDYLFSSSSAAAIIVMGRSANGLTEWKLKSGKTLKEYEKE